MGLFRKNKVQVAHGLHVETRHDTRVEVVVHKNATQDAILMAQEANQRLSKLLEQNGFTLKIELATKRHK